MDPAILAKAAFKPTIKVIFDDKAVSEVRLSQIRLAPEADELLPPVVEPPKPKGAVVPRYLVTVWQQQRLKAQMNLSQLLKDAEESTRLRVISAWYGPLIGGDDQRVDVADTLRAQVVHGKLAIKGPYRLWFGPATSANSVLRLELRVLGIVDVISKSFNKDEPVELDAVALASERNVDLLSIEKSALGEPAGKAKAPLKPKSPFALERKAVGRKSMKKRGGKGGNTKCELCDERHESPITYHSMATQLVCVREP